MNKKTFSDVIVVGFALFAMFFGAGNLIFPPSLGLMAGDKWVFALIGFLLTGVGMPLLGILAVSKSGGTMEKFAGKVSPTFAKILGT
ncbi:MAG: braB, partial [Clostridiales bacterium]|nr:braB [Clostridiales bacterium]